MNSEAREAREVVEKISKGILREFFEPIRVSSLLEVLALEGDEKSFKLIVNVYVNQIRGDVVSKNFINELGIDRGYIEDNPLAYVEWLCMLADNNIVVGFSEREKYKIDSKNPPEIKRTQAFFQKLYGERFYQHCIALEDEPGVFRIKDYR